MTIRVTVNILFHFLSILQSILSQFSSRTSRWQKFRPHVKHSRLVNGNNTLCLSVPLCSLLIRTLALRRASWSWPPPHPTLTIHTEHTVQHGASPNILMQNTSITETSCFLCSTEAVGKMNELEDSASHNFNSQYLNYFLSLWFCVWFVLRYITNSIM